MNHSWGGGQVKWNFLGRGSWWAWPRATVGAHAEASEDASGSGNVGPGSAMGAGCEPRPGGRP